MGVDPADSQPKQLTILNEMQYFVIRGDSRVGQSRKSFEETCTVGQISAGKFPEDERMNQHNAFEQRQFKRRMGPAQMIDPD